MGWAFYAQQSLHLFGIELNSMRTITSPLLASVTPELPSQNTLLANVVYDWQLSNATGDITDAGTIEIKGGKITLDGNASSGEILTFSPSANQPWFSATPATFSYTFHNPLSNDNG